MDKEYNKPVPPTVLVVDDSPDNLSLISGLLKNIYRIKVANNGEKAIMIAQGKDKPDLILLDVMMPDLSGYDVCKILKSDPACRDIPIIFLTALTGSEDEENGLSLGASDFITKPINPPTLLARVKTQLENKAARDFLHDQNNFLENEITNRTKEIMAIQDVTILSMASLAETRDSDTGNHIRRTQYYVLLLANTLKFHPRFVDFLTEQNIHMLFKSAPLHDIGKVGIPDKILLKPGKLSYEEFEIMKTHTTLGRDALDNAVQSLGFKVDFLDMAKDIAYYHQEKWDGSGYPEGISGDAIPISARLMALADVYDALISRRVYKEGMSHDEAFKIIVQGSGSHFDPDIVDAFISGCEEFQNIAQRYVDTDLDLKKKQQYINQASN